MLRLNEADEPLYRASARRAARGPPPGPDPTVQDLGETQLCMINTARLTYDIVVVRGRICGTPLKVGNVLSVDNGRCIDGRGEREGAESGKRATKHGGSNQLSCSGYGRKMCIRDSLYFIPGRLCSLHTGDISYHSSNDKAQRAFVWIPTCHG